MSGIAGFTGRSSFDDIHRFQDALNHRGPDEQGFFRDQDVALSHNRLAILDFATGRQPILNEDKTCAIVLDGDIYNYRELREDLKRRHRFATATDAEAVLHLYEEKGTSVSEYLKGDFAFCIWDSRQRTCFLSRDPLGVKPLFYSITPAGDLVFCSELRTLLLHRGVQADLDVEGIAEYFTCLYVSGNRTVLKSIRKLQPGESLLWKYGAVRTWKYWSVPEPDPVTPRFEELNEKVLALLKTAVKRRLMADVPVGALLSGGLDSSLTVALAGEESRRLHTFSITYDDSDFDEFQYARLVAERYGTTHHEIVLVPRAAEVIEELIDSIDEPVADSSAITTFLISRETRELAKVVLSGVGGDEMFFGYPRHRDAKLGEALPGVFRRPLTNVTRLWSSHFGKGHETEADAGYATRSSFLDPDVRQRLLPDICLIQQSPEQQILDMLTSGKGSVLDRVFRFDLARYIPCDLLQLCDNMTMAHSLKLRAPFCDVDLVGEIARTPAAVRFHGYRLKPMLRHIAKKYLPEKVVNRTKRKSMPIGRWFRNELREHVESQFTRNRLPAIVDFVSVQSMWEEHKSGRADHAHVLWAVLLLSHWLQKKPTGNRLSRAAHPH